MTINLLGSLTSVKCENQITQTFAAHYQLKSSLKTNAEESHFWGYLGENIAAPLTLSSTTYIFCCVNFTSHNCNLNETNGSAIKELSNKNMGRYQT